jgi:taurine dioxygenase
VNTFNPATDRVTLTPQSSTIGAEITGVDLREPLAPATRDALYGALLDWKVIFFRDQDITAEQHLAFAREFGDLEIHPFAAGDETHPEILRIHHGEKAPGKENVWHSDVTWRTAPSLGSILRLRKVPDVGGDTLFADMTAAYRGLPADIRDAVEGKLALHDFSFFRDRLLRKGATDAEMADFDRQYPNPEHPVIRTHPDTGEQSIYVNRAFTRRILGVSDEESTRLLEFLYAQATYPEYQCRFRWTENAIAFWDNRACQHYAVSDYWPRERIAERVTVVGDTPFHRPGTEAAPALDLHFQGGLRTYAGGTGGPNDVMAVRRA